MNRSCQATPIIFNLKNLSSFPSRPMPVCKFWLQGNCKFGTRCRYDHPTQPQAITNNSAEPSLIDVLYSDLHAKLPQYHFSSYSNSFFPNQNLIHGDLSPEELRFKAYTEGRETGQLINYNLFVDQLERHFAEQREHLLKSTATTATTTIPKPTIENTQANTTVNYQRVFPVPTQQDIEAFSSDKFHFQKIPELPPTLEMCLVAQR